MANLGLLDPEFDTRVRALTAAARDGGFSPNIVSGYRSPQDQARAIDSVARNVYGRPASMVDFSRGIPGYAAPVGGSQHQKGTAVDFQPGPALDWVRANAARYGVDFPSSLSKTDPVHGQIDTKFYGPVQDPRDRDGSVAPESPPAQSLPVTASTTSNPSRAPQMSDKRENYGLLGDTSIGRFVSGLNAAIGSPTFQSGAAMFDAGANGLNAGAGFVAGGKAASQASAHALALAKAQREMQQMQQRDQLWQGVTSGQTPPWAQSLPAGTLDLAKALGPDAGSQLITTMLAKNADRDLDVQRLDLARSADQRAGRVADAQIHNLTRKDEPEAVRVLAAARAAEQRGDTEAAQMLRNSLKGGDPMSQAVASWFKPPAEAAPAPASPIRPQSFNAPEGAPAGLVLTAGPDGAPAAAPATDEPMVDVPGMGRMPRSEAQKRALGLALTGKGPAGQMIMDATKGQEIGKDAANDLDKKMIAASDNLTNLAGLLNQFKPEYQEIPERGKMAWTALKAKVGRGDAIAPEERSKLEAFSAYRADALDAFNTYIKAITGAAMTESEAKRIQAAFPSAGHGIFDGDDPISFKSNLDMAFKKTEMAIARYNYARKNGKDWQYIGLEQMRGVLKDRSAAVRSQISTANPNAAPDEITSLTRQALKQEFGI